MAQNLLRLRRPLTASLRFFSSTSLLSSSLPRSSPLSSSSAAVAQSSPRRALEFQPQSRSFRSSSFSSARPPSIYNNQNDEIGPDTILFEGCDYNHWLIVMDFPKGENKPPPEEMVRTYEETCARGLNISVEEAKKKIYACSTTTYTGFQVLMTEEESTKFEGVPGVIFILPDSYIDPQNKEYGGDKYENGHITPRPPPFQYERQGSRFRDRNRFDRQGPYQQGNSSYGRQEPPPRTPQNYPPQTYGPPGQGENRGHGPPGQGENRGHSPVNSPVGRDAYQPGRDSIPPNQGNYNQRVQSNSPQGDQNTYAPPGYGQAAPSSGAHGGYGPGASTGGYGPGASTGGYGPGASTGGYGPGASTGGYGPGASRGGYGPGASTGGYGSGASTGGYGPGASTGGYGPGARTGGYGPGASTGSYGPGASTVGYGPGASTGGYGPGASTGGYGPGPSAGGYGPGPSAGGYGPGPSAGGYGPGPSAGASGQGPIPGTQVQGPGSGYPGNGDQGFTQGEQMQGEQTNSAYVGRTGTDQGRY